MSWTGPAGAGAETALDDELQEVAGDWLESTEVLLQQASAHPLFTCKPLAEWVTIIPLYNLQSTFTSSILLDDPDSTMS